MSNIQDAVNHLRNGKMVIMIDDEDRENEGDLVLAAEFATAENINFMAKEARGLICLALENKRTQELELPMMTHKNQARLETAFTVSIEAREGVSTGISAADRAHTIRTAVNPAKGARDIVSPGHIFPLRALDGGVLVRAGHTEGSVDLCKIAKLTPAAVICEIMNEDGTMARLTDLRAFAQKHDLPIVSIKELIEYRMAKESLVDCVAEAELPWAYREYQDVFRMFAFKSKIDGTEHLALVKGEPSDPCLVRVHSECLTGDALGSLRCDCGEQLQAALAQISKSNNGMLVYMRNHEGRSIGLANKIKAYSLQDKGLDTVEANQKLGFGPDLRQYGIGAQIIRALGIKKMRLMTNNPKKVISLSGYGLEIVERVAIEMPANEHNLAYLSAKKSKLGHHLNMTPKNSAEKESH